MTALALGNNCSGEAYGIFHSRFKESNRAQVLFCLARGQWSKQPCHDEAAPLYRYLRCCTGLVAAVPFTLHTITQWFNRQFSNLITFLQGFAIAFLVPPHALGKK
ncbi:expressed unknown protein [Seminavis robusta]|uniref:Uncharacterized protein n=1 Tax=Seminavis robusta TaxID=568900 RepID=A0A9N8EBL6_9STRA|nr:expressed unknown protein [Seminavis robusta]|eukprot:Sro931_g221441.1  (105) ;mRNA; r:17734-18048